MQFGNTFYKWLAVQMHYKWLLTFGGKCPVEDFLLAVGFKASLGTPLQERLRWVILGATAGVLELEVLLPPGQYSPVHQLVGEQSQQDCQEDGRQPVRRCLHTPLDACQPLTMPTQHSMQPSGQRVVCYSVEYPIQTDTPLSML